MVNYDKATGSAGTIRIEDTGTQVRFWLRCTDDFTFSGGLPWSGVVNGVAVSGSFPWPASSSDDFRLVATYNVSTSQTVQFNLGATGTSGFGGPTSHSAVISRATAPGAPGMPSVSDVTQESASFSWTAAAANGSAVTNYGFYISTSPTFETHVYQAWLGLTTTFAFDEFLPGGTYYVRTRAQNGVGTGPYSPTRTVQLNGGCRRWTGAEHRNVRVKAWDGDTWRVCRVKQWDGEEWVETR